jgi:ABC-type transporter Mla subunit MlaD
MRLAIPGPRDIVRATEQGYQALEQAIALVPRMVRLVDAIEQIVARVEAVVPRIEETDRQARAVVAHSDATATAAQAVVDEAARTTARVVPLLDTYQPTLEKLAPIAEQLANTTSPEEVAAIVALIDSLPDIVRRLDADILPILNNLDTVAPDLRDLLDVSRELNEMLGGLPGLGRIKRRIEERQDEEDEHRELDHPD